MLKFKGSGALTPCPTATTTTGHMDILPGFKLCRKGLHQYLVNKRTCPECNRIATAKYREKNKEYLKEKNKKHQKKWNEKNKNYYKEIYEKNKEQIKATAKQRYEENKEQKLALNKKWQQNNKDKRKKIAKKWRQNNKGKVNAITAKRHAAKKQAIPAWSNLKTVEKIYRKAAKLTKNMGIKHQVDHIYPLVSKFMCGLHVETNLQILTAEENASKGNRTWPGQLDCQKGSVYDIFSKELTDLLNDQKN
jgi:hypothetical protein